MTAERDNGNGKIIPLENEDYSPESLEVERASFSDREPQFCNSANKFESVFTLAGQQLGRPFSENKVPRLDGISNGRLTSVNSEPDMSSRPPAQCCATCGSHKSSDQDIANSHPDVLNMLRNVLDRLSAIDTRLERVERFVNADMFNKGC